MPNYQSLKDMREKKEIKEQEEIAADDHFCSEYWVGDSGKQMEIAAGIQIQTQNGRCGRCGRKLFRRFRVGIVAGHKGKSTAIIQER